ncbi:unnamed protein product [Auanema sp. JU1783]|nr:unnamed protein product [Auanema sp. JU1783]
MNESALLHGNSLTEQSYSFYWNCIVNVWFIGFLAGIWISRWITDHFGRKPAFLIGNGFNVLGSLSVYFSIVVYEPIVLFIGRFISSTATSISYCSLILYLQEVAPNGKKGSTSCLNGCIYSLIAILGITLGNDELLGKHLAYYLGFGIFPCIFSFVALFFLPETPKYLVSKNKLDEAEDAILFYHGKSTRATSTLKTIQDDIDSADNQLKPKIVDVFKQRHLRNALWLALAAIQNTVALWTILLSSTYYLEETGVEHHIAQWSSTIMAIAYFAGTSTGVFTIEKFGRRPLLIWSNILNMSSLLLYTAFAKAEPYLPGSKYGCLPMLALFGWSYGWAVGPVARFIAAELVPTKYRSLMTAIVFSENTIVNVITAFSCRPLFHVLGPYAFCILYVVPSIFCLFYLFHYLPETKGKEISEIVNILRNQ